MPDSLVIGKARKPVLHHFSDMEQQRDAGRFLLFGQPDPAHATFADHLQQVVPVPRRNVVRGKWRVCFSPSLNFEPTFDQELLSMAQICSEGTA